MRGRATHGRTRLRLASIGADKRQQGRHENEAAPTNSGGLKLLVSDPLIERRAAETGRLGGLPNGAGRPLREPDFFVELHRDVLLLVPKSFTFTSDIPDLP